MSANLFLVMAHLLRSGTEILVLERGGKPVDLLFGLVFTDPVLLLHSPDELVPLARNHIELIIRELAPLHSRPAL